MHGRDRQRLHALRLQLGELRHFRQREDVAPATLDWSAPQVVASPNVQVGSTRVARLGMRGPDDVRVVLEGSSEVTCSLNWTAVTW
jgi:hypothetical protein